MLTESCHKKEQIPNIPETQFVGTSCRRYFCRCQLSPPINEYTYCVLKRICRKIVKEICNEKRQEVYSVFDGGNSIRYESLKPFKQRHRDSSFLKSRKSRTNPQQQIADHKKSAVNVMRNINIKKGHTTDVLKESGTSMSIEVNLRGKVRNSNRKHMPPEEFVDKTGRKRSDTEKTGNDEFDSNKHDNHTAKLRLSANNKTANKSKPNKFIRQSHEIMEIQRDQALNNKHEKGKSLQVLVNSGKLNTTQFKVGESGLKTNLSSQDKSELNQNVQSKLQKNQKNQQANTFPINSSKRVERYERNVSRRREQEPKPAQNTNKDKKKQPDQVSKQDNKKKKIHQTVGIIEAKRSDLRPFWESTRLKKFKSQSQSNPMHPEFATKKQLQQKPVILMRLPKKQTSKMLVIPTVGKFGTVKRKPAVISRTDAVKASDYLRAKMEYKDICFLRNFNSCHVSTSQCAHPCPKIPNHSPRTCVQCTS